ncbi:RHS repeat-associated core domain-containing protein [Salinibius halmophilus]|uniref:RHS repeat-associated core domain-containing protein n=1 Tax=Salinibius halmophilus TaxID=1853216 RepID=UPI001314FA3A|nr:RHS repeat-associated core domain-containing protein [Salinibius halmophilus]
MENWLEDEAGTPEQEAAELLYPNGEALKALPHEVKTKLFPAPENWGTVDPIHALGLVRDEHTRFFQYQRGSWQEIPRPLTLHQKDWICVQRLNKPIAGVGQASSAGSNSAGLNSGSASSASANNAQANNEPASQPEPVIINEAAAPEQTYTLTLAYMDENGEPMENTDFKVELDTGQIIEGSLDENGQYVIADLPAAVANITYAPRESELARLRGELEDALTGIIDETKQRAAIEQAVFDEEGMLTKGLILTGAVMVKFWDGAVDTVEAVVEAGAGVIDIASDLAKLQIQFFKRLLAGEALEMLEELYVEIARLGGIALDVAQKAWYVLKLIALDTETWQMLLKFPSDYFSSLSTVSKVEVFGAIGFEIIFAIACAAAIALTGGVAAAIVGPAATMRYSVHFTKVVSSVRQIWRLFDKLRVNKPSPTQRIEQDIRVNSQQPKPEETLVVSDGPRIDHSPEQPASLVETKPKNDVSDAEKDYEDNNADNNDEHEDNGEVENKSTESGTGSGTCGAEKATPCENDPISMVTGEELYQTVDFSIPGVVPINFVRQYRTGTCDRRSSMGYGWSHSFSEHFKVNGNELEFVDQEFLSTYWGAVKKRVFVRNQHGATVYWGGEEITLKKDGVVKRFRQLEANGDYVLTHIATIDQQQSWHLLYELVQLASGEQLLPTKLVATWGDQLSIRYSQHGIAAIDWQTVNGSKSKRLARYIVNDQSDLIAARDAQGRVEQFRFEQHTIRMRKLASGAIYDFEWTELGPKARATKQKERGGTYDYRFEWNLASAPNRNISRAIDSNGVVKEYEFDDKAQLLRKTMPDGSEERWHYNSLGDLLWYQNGNGERTEYAYDGQQRLTKQVNALGQQTRIVYHGDTFLPARVTNAAGHTTRYTYNSLEQLTAVHYPDGREAKWFYDADQLVKQVDANGTIHQYEWHPQWGSIARYVQSVKAKAGKTNVLAELTFDYDEQGRLISKTQQPLNTQQKPLTTHYVYDAQGQLISQIDPFGKSQKLKYDSFGRVVAHIDAAGRTTQFEYGKFAQVERLIQPDGNEVRYQYDKERNLTALINQNGQAHKFEYDAHERISREITVDGRTTDYTYDGAGRVVALKEGELTATFERNALGMLIHEQHEAAGKQSVTIDYQYDELNRLIMADNGHAQTELAYDLAGRLTEELNRQSFNPFGQRAQPHQHKIGIHYRGDGLVSHLHHESFKPKPQGLKYSFLHSDGRKVEWYQEYHWNSQQQLVGMLLNDEQLFSQQFNSAGQLTKRQQGAHQLEFSYDPESRLAQTKRLGSAHELIKQRDYGYDEYGRLAQISEQGSTSAKPFVKQYQYDAVDRLTSVVRGESGDLVAQQVNQDKAGNLLPQGLTELTNNQLPFWGDRHFDYDSHGNLKTETSGANGCKKKQFFYNAKHQLVALLQSVDRTATRYSEYLYDALGRRIEKIVWQLDATVTGVETELELAELARKQGEVINHERFAWQGSTLVHVRKLTNGGNQQLTAERYIYEPGTHVPLAMHDTELGTLHFDVDHLGTPKGLFDGEGQRLWQAEHSVYGQIESERSFKLHPLTGEKVAPKIRFQGQYEDSESGLFYNLNRYYDAEVGRFTTQDPIGLLGGLNAYQYCPNPVGWVDPLGLAAKDCSNNFNIRVATAELAKQFLNGEDTTDIAAKFARLFTHSAPGKNEGKVILGRWAAPEPGKGTSDMGYIDIAKSEGGIWFESTDSFFGDLKKFFDDAGFDEKRSETLANDAAFKVNEQFLLQNADQRRTFVLSNVTPEQALTHFSTSATAREVNMLNSQHFKDLGYELMGNEWTIK